ncbi:MAG: ribokinase [Fimbriimonadaceae bacterium]
MSMALVVGSANADLVYSVTEFPSPGQTISSNGFNIYAGGKGANQAVACARAGASVQFCANVGSDNFGEFLTKSLTENGVALDNLSIVSEPTGSAVILVNQSGENQIVLNAGANDKLDANRVEAAIKATMPQLILVQLEIPKESVDAVLASKVRVILNPAPYRDLSDSNLNGLFAITPNETECAQLCGILPTTNEAAREAAQKLIAKGISNVVITLGRRGCYWTNNQEECFVSPPKVTPVDTTGAGDVFNGALMARLIEKDDFPTALKFAVTAASISTTRHGALNSAPRLSEVYDLLSST